MLDRLHQSVQASLPAETIPVASNETYLLLIGIAAILSALASPASAVAIAWIRRRKR